MLFVEVKKQAPFIGACLSGIVQFSNYLTITDRLLYVPHAVVPVVYTSREDPEAKLRALKRTWQSEGPNKGFAAGSSSSSEQYAEPGASGSGIGNSEVSLTEADRKWRLEPATVQEWEVCYHVVLLCYLTSL
mgnify:CR=1 FL=1